MIPLYSQATIRRGTAADTEAIRTIRNTAIAETTAIWTSVQQSPEDCAQWLAGHLERNSVLVAELRSNVVGFACWGPWRAKEGYRHTVEDSVYLAEGHRGHGLGRILLKPLIDSARSSGAHVMIADIEASNEASVRLHQRLGFEMIGTLHEVGTKFDRWLDLTILRRLL
jgi:phosphinothricin acetyltransferase